MKKKYLPKAVPPKKMIRGAYDKKGDWWFESDIQTFSNGMITLFFNRDRKHIKIIEREEEC